MTDDAFFVSEMESGRVRLFKVDINEAQLDRILHPRPDMPPTAAAIADLVGLDWIDPGYAEIFNIADLEGMGLANYLVQGAGISEATIAEHRLLLDQVEDIVLILYSKAFENNEYRLLLQPNVQLIEVFNEDTPEISFKPLPNKSAIEPANLGTAPPNPQTAIIKAMLALPVLVILVALFVWFLLL